MKKIFLAARFFLPVCFVLTGIISCKKSEPTAASSFSWKFNNGATTTANLHKAFQNTVGASPTILATKGSNILSFDISISVSSFNAGAYNITGSGANSVLYIDNSGNTYTASAGTVTITSYANNLVSGNFSVTVGGSAGGPYPLTGSFTETPVVF